MLNMRSVEESPNDAAGRAPPRMTIKKIPETKCIERVQSDDAKYNRVVSSGRWV